MLLKHVQHTLRQCTLRQTVDHDRQMLRAVLQTRHDLHRRNAVREELLCSGDLLRGSIGSAEIGQLRLRICLLDHIVPQED